MGQSNIIGSLGRDIKPSIAISSSRVNMDNPRPDVSIRRGDLLSSLEDIDKRARDRIRPVIEGSRGAVSVRLVPQHLSRDSNGGGARSYKPDDYTSRLPDKKRSEEERRYILRTKFRELNQRNPSIEIPDSIHDADSLERMYYEALQCHRRTKVGASWFVYLGVGYFVLQYILERFGLKLPDNFVLYQMRALSHYTEVIRQLGDAGGISIGSSWPAWIKLLVIVILQTFIFVIAYKITGSEQAAAGAQDFVASMNFIGGAKKDNSDLEAESAAVDVGNFIGTIKGMMNGGGGGDGGNFLQNIVKVFSGMASSSAPDIDLEDIPEPEEEVPASSRRSNIFDD